MTRVLIPSVLRSYTGATDLVADGATVEAVLRDLDRRFPGLRFRIVDEQDHIRRHVRLFVNGEQTFDLRRPMAAEDELCIVQALSGG